MKAVSWLTGVISGLCIVPAIGLYAERASNKSEVAAFKDDAEIAWRNYREMEAAFNKCHKGNTVPKAVK